MTIKNKNEEKITEESREDGLSIRAVVFNHISFGPGFSTTIDRKTSPPIAIYEPTVNGVAIYYGAPGSTSTGVMYLGLGDLAYVIGNVLHLDKNS